MLVLVLIFGLLAAIDGSVAVAEGGDSPAAPGTEGGKDSKAGEAKSGDAKNEEPNAPKWDLVFPIRVQGLMFCDVKINDDGRVWNFLIDSGASQSVLAQRTADLLKLESTKAPVQGQGVGKQDVFITQNVKFTTKGHEWKCGMGLVTDLSRIADMSGEYMDGIIGSDWLMQWKHCEFDFVAREARFRKWEEGKGKRSLNDMMAGMMGGLPGMPGGGGGGGGGEEDDDEGFSFGAPGGAVPMPVGDEDGKAGKAGESGGKPLSTVSIAAIETEFTMLEINNPMLGGGLVIASLWFVDMKVNDKPAKMLFDTGASSLLVLDKAYGNTCDVGTSMTFPVTGLGEADATMGIASSFVLSSHSESGRIPAIVMNLAETFSQLDGITELPLIGPILKLLGVKSPSLKGIVGLPFAMRYRSMLVDYERMKLVFVPYTAEDAKADPAPEDPRANDPELVAAVEKTWKGEGGMLGLEASSLKFEAWEEYGLDGGLVVKALAADGAAQKAGIQAGDIIAYLDTRSIPGVDPKKLEMEGHAALKDGMLPMRSMASAAILAAHAGAGAKLRFRVWRPEAEGAAGSEAPAADGETKAKRRKGSLMDVEIALDRITDGISVPEAMKEKAEPEGE